MKKLLLLLAMAILLATTSAFAEEYKTITINTVYGSFDTKVPANMEDFSNAPMQYRWLRGGRLACGWQYRLRGSFYSIVVHCENPLVPIALVTRISQGVERWLYDEEGIPQPCSIEQYIEKVYEDPFAVNPEFQRRKQGIDV